MWFRRLFVPLIATLSLMLNGFTPMSMTGCVSYEQVETAGTADHREHGPSSPGSTGQQCDHAALQIGSCGAVFITSTFASAPAALDTGSADGFIATRTPGRMTSADFFHPPRPLV